VFEAFVVTLREGIEAALVVGIILIFLRRTGRAALERWVFAGLGAAALASVAGAALLRRLPVDEEAWEGALLLAASLFVATLVVWMWRTARQMKDRIEGRLEAAAAVGGRRAGLGLFAVTFVLVFREGAETVLLLAAVHLTTESILAFAGALLGLALAVFFGVALVRGSVRLDVGRFFRVTGIVLLIFALHLLAGSLHEFAEAGAVPIGRRTMRILGPIVKSQALVVASMLALPLIVLLVPGRPAGPEPADGPERRLRRAGVRRDRTWRALAGGAGLAVVLSLTASLTYSRFPKQIDPPRMLAVEPSGEVRVPVAGLGDGRLHRFGVAIEGVVVRFLVIESGGGLGVALDACQVCGAHGYVESRGQIVCLACAADINPATIGAEGGCNPLPLRSRLEGGFLIVSAGDLASGRRMFAAAASSAAATPGRGAPP
jgi:FTR1 family protein